MGRPKKDNHPVTVRLNSDILNRLNQFSDDTGLTKTTAIEKALIVYMDEYYKDQETLKKLKQRS